MKRASETNEVEVLDAAFYKSGGELGWSVFGTARRSASEILEDLEEDDEGIGFRSAVMSVMMERTLDGWSVECDVEKVGARVFSLAKAVGFFDRLSGAKSKVSKMRGVLEELGGEPGAEMARKILESWTWDHPDERAMGKRVLAFGLFFNHAELEGWSVRSLAKAVGESRTWMSKRVRKECNRPIENAGGSVRASWQQGEEQRRKTARGAKGRTRTEKTND